MTPIMQKNLHNSELNIKGDCLRACICSLLDISDDGVPNFIEDPEYPMNMHKFIWDRHLYLQYSKIPPDDIDYYMVWGKSPRGIQHSVIYNKQGLIHDPHPEGGGVIPEFYLWLQYDNDI